MEVIIAAKGEGDDRVLYEMADMFYHSLVLLAARTDLGSAGTGTGAPLQMTEQASPSRFVPAVESPDRSEEQAYWFLFQGDRLVVARNDEATAIPLTAKLSTVGLTTVRRQYLGYLDSPAGRRHCFSGEVSHDAPLPDGFYADELRQLSSELDDTLFGLAGRAKEIMHWDCDHQFCGRCATPVDSLPQERAKRCPACGLTSYPRLSPAIIIAVTREVEGQERILLARNHRFPPGRFSVVAGFVEPGETLEECAAREVREEVGISIRNVCYFGSQPWPFPNSLMIGFTAEYAGGDIILEESEIAEAGWFAAEDLPKLPPKISIARRLIDAFVRTPAA